MEVSRVIAAESRELSNIPLGFVHGLDSERYHSGPGLSQSSLKTFAGPGGPAKYKAGVRKESPALKFGGILHTATLEPWLLEKEYCVTDLDREGTNKWAEAELMAGGRILVKRKEWNQACRMRDAIMAHPTASQLITPEAEREVSMFAPHPRTGILRRGRADILRRDWGVIGDVKSTVDASRAEFARTCGEWGYDWQEAFYRDLYASCARITGDAYRPEIEAFVFIAVEKERPHLIGCYEIDPQDIKAAHYAIERVMLEFQLCRETDTWPGYDTEISRLRIEHPRGRQLPD